MVERDTQPERILLIPPSEEQAWPSFHVKADLLRAFLEHLAGSGIRTVQPPEPLGRLGPGNSALWEIEIEEEHTVEELKAVLTNFWHRRDGRSRQASRAR